jgi:uncharacterized protein (DUF1810 family)
MRLIHEILIQVLAREEMHVVFPQLRSDIAEMAESAALRALEAIRAAVADDGLSDFECVEAIVRIFEELGSGGGGRHDF